MTLNKAIQELFEELNRTDLSEEEKKALEKYKTWLCSIKTTVSNNNPYWHPYPLEKPTENLSYLVSIKCPHAISTTIATWWDDEFVDIYRNRNDKVIAWAELPNPFDARVWV